MATYPVNAEGMTFYEWVCAAGYARSDREGTPVRTATRYGIRYYTKEVHNAWRNGEDPTEWRRHREAQAYTKYSKAKESDSSQGRVARPLRAGGANQSASC